jgi:hypothetical protein
MRGGGGDPFKEDPFEEDFPGADSDPDDEAGERTKRVFRNNKKDGFPPSRDSPAARLQSQALSTPLYIVNLSF